MLSPASLWEMPHAFCDSSLVVITRPAFEAFSQAFHGNATQFRAASSLGYCALRLDEPQAALGYFQAALGIHPGLEHVRLCIARLEKSLKY